MDALKRTLGALVLVAGGLGGCARSTTARQHLPPLTTVQAVDLRRYMGTWYEIASIPQRFQKGCRGTRATYSLKEDGEVEVRNACRKGDDPQAYSGVTGRAVAVPKSGGAKLRVSFFWPFWGDYWVIDLDTDYRVAAVGSPGRDTLWILCRSPQLDDASYAALGARLAAKGYDLTRLVRTPQP